MKADRYSTLLPIIAFEYTRMISSSDLVQLIDKDLGEIYEFLHSTPYGKVMDFSFHEGDNMHLLMEEALIKNYAQIVDKLLHFSSAYVKRFLQCFLFKYDIQNLKTIIRLLDIGMNRSHISSYIIPIGFFRKETCDQLLHGVYSVTELMKTILQNSHLPVPWFAKILQSYLENPDLEQFFHHLEITGYTQLFQTMRKLTKHDRKIATNLIGLEIDTHNLKTILKSHHLHFPLHHIKSHLLPSLAFPEALMDDILQYQEKIEILDKYCAHAQDQHVIYQKIFCELRQKVHLPTIPLENILDRAIFAMSLYIYHHQQDYYHIGYPLAFLHLKWLEIRNLRVIINESARHYSEQARNLIITLKDLSSQPKFGNKAQFSL